MKKIIMILIFLMLVFGVASLSKAQSNYVTEKDKRASQEKCIQKGYASLVGKTFIAEPETFGFGQFYEEANFLSTKFSVKKPESFTIVRYWRAEWKKGTNISESGDWWEVRFKSGKVGYIQRESGFIYHSYISDIESNCR